MDSPPKKEQETPLTINSSAFHNALFSEAEKLGISDLSSTSIDLTKARKRYLRWIDKGYHANLDYLTKHGEKRFRPKLLVEGTASIITAKLNYFNPDYKASERLTQKDQAYVSMYALGRDYHKVLRKQLNTLGKWMKSQISDLEFRAFVDSAPVLEGALSHQSGLGFFGKNTIIIHPKAGSFFFLGEIFINQVIDIQKEREEMASKCGSCTRCIDACPTGAIVSPYEVDAAKCISYLTIEHHGAFPLELRSKIGNRVFGCDDCQIVCPWNRFSTRTLAEDFTPRHQLDSSSLRDLFSWTEEEFLKKSEGSPIRRAGYARWLRNIAIGLGNDKYSEENINLLKEKADFPDESVKEHVNWAIVEQLQKKKRNPIILELK